MALNAVNAGDEVAGVFARRLYTVVATPTVARDAVMIEAGWNPRGRAVAGLTRRSRDHVA